MKKIAILASGSGTNAQNIIEYFNKTFDKRVVLVCTNNPNAFVIERAKKAGVPVLIFNRKEWMEEQVVRNRLLNEKIDLVVLAGFLWLIPETFIHAFPQRIINIHPALLPEYGGKGMYGMHVHEAVLKHHEKRSGITIHYVNEKYDAGEIIFQAHCEVHGDDTPESLAKRIHALEYRYYPEVINQLLDSIQ
ncbi:MAG: phosphoribosylglycinamide formyltransferase [Chlorobi bacterium]|nr:phosphoribosylglycinamide formyltransferase [Chlorobiota bacterium]